MRRRLIGLLTANPESIYSQRIMEGVFSQCRSYGYDVAVFTPMVQVMHYFKEYLHGELNIYNLINYELLDGVILDTNTLQEDQITTVVDKLLVQLREKCSKPVITIDIPLADYPFTKTDDATAIYQMTTHVIEVHGCRKIYFLNGIEGHEVAKKRLRGFCSAMEAHHLPYDESQIFHGAFWYTNGEALADRIISGELEMPEAVICASDHIAIGLINRLTSHGIRVPEQIIVTGHDGTAEAAFNEVVVSTYIPEIGKAAADAVDYLHQQIEPYVPLQPYHSKEKHMICGESCGCPSNYHFISRHFYDALIHNYQNETAADYADHVDLGKMNNSFMMETLTATKDVSECLYSILYYTYLLRPFRNYYLCLREHWLDNENIVTSGYPDVMREVIHGVAHEEGDEAAAAMQHSSNSHQFNFDVREMLPQLAAEREEPSVFYFTPIHFQDNTLGYSVLECDLQQQKKIGSVYHVWLRIVNNVLEMKRAQKRLTLFSERDAMTGIMNRRALKRWFNETEAEDHSGKTAIAFVIDMDRLKFINDAFGHAEGDFGIRTIANMTQSITQAHEICVRTGGDEFMIVGVGDYSPDETVMRTLQFQNIMEAMNALSQKPYSISASIGAASAPYEPGIFQQITKEADTMMYANKSERKMHRETTFM